MIVVLAGGIGAARFLRGLLAVSPDVVVIDPPELVAEVRGRLEGVLSSLEVAR